MLCNSSTYPPPLQLNQTPCDSDNAHHPSVPLHTLRTSAGIVHVPNISHHFLASHQCLPSQGSPDAQHGCHLALATSEASWWMKSALRLGVHSLIPNCGQHHVLQEHLVCVRRDSTLLSLYCKIWRGTKDVRFAGLRMDMVKAKTDFSFWRPQPHSLLKRDTCDIWTVEIPVEFILFSTLPQRSSVSFSGNPLWLWIGVTFLSPC